jgi:hypothetical protein
MEDLRELIERCDVAGIRDVLTRHPEMANAGIALGSQDAAPAHPLHRLCDGVFNRTYSDEQAREMALVFISCGADVNGGTLVANKDTPLTAAASLHAELTGISYVEHGASVLHPGCHGGTALHWAAWCGRDKLVATLLQAGASLEQRCKDFYSTPLFWAIHGYKLGGEGNRWQQLECARLLIASGAQKDTRNGEGLHILDLLDGGDEGARALLT